MTSSVSTGGCATYVASAEQQQLWFVEQLAPEQSVYNTSLRLAISGPLDTGRLRLAVERVVRRHPALWTSFAPSAGGELTARVHEPGAVPFEVTDLSAQGSSSEAVAAGLIRDLAARRIDLRTAPLLRCHLLRLDHELHWLVLASHHIVVDGKSFAILAREVPALYQRLKHSRQADLPVPARSYADYVTLKEQLLREGADSATTYWSTALAGSTPTELPTDYPRPAPRRWSGDIRRRVLSPSLAPVVARVAREQRATAFVVLTAALFALAHRYTREQDLTLGVAVDGRPDEDFDDVVGHFVDMVALRIEVDDSSTFSWLIRQVRRALLDALAHRDLPFLEVVRSVGPHRDPSQSPLFLVGVTTGEPATVTDGDVCWSELPGVGTSARFDLNFELHIDASRVAVEAEYSDELFAGETIDRLLAHYETLLQGACLDVDAPLAALPLVDAAALARAAARPVRSFPSDTTLHALVTRQARRRPHAPAVGGAGHWLTYGELEAGADRLAWRLVELGAGVGERVAVCLDRTERLPLALLAVLKSGAAYVPIHDDDVAEHARSILSDAQPVAVVTDAAHRHLFREVPDGSVVLLDGGLDAGDAASRGPVPPRAAPEDPAYVIYTSGSTGTPKGVVVEHRHVARLFASTRDWFGFATDDVWALFHSYAFDVSVWEMFGALCHGGRLVVVPREVAVSAPALLQTLVDESVTVLCQTPSAFAVLMQADERLRPSLTALRYVIFAGEALDYAALAPWVDRHGDAAPRLVNMYGPTETTVYATCRHVREVDVRRATARSLIGEPLPDLRIYVMEGGLQLAPDGVPGEIVVAGPGVARGYLNRPDLTKERFFPDPLGSGLRCYRTGDLARRRFDGELEYHGRLDGQVKIRGFRVEPGEVRQAIRSHPHVHDAAVVARGSGASAELVAYYRSGPPEVPPDELRRYLARRLPVHLRPSQFVAVTDLPRTRSGKLDTRALPAPAPRRRSRAVPDDEIGRDVAALWAEVLGYEDPYLDDDFFDAGGHSLRAAAVVERIARRYGVEPPLASFLADPTLRGLAGLVRDALSRPADGGRAAADEERPVRIGGGDAAPPLVLVHPIGGSSTVYREFGQGWARAVWAIAARAVERRPTSLASMADRYTGQLARDLGRSVVLGGWSFGGLVAFEMAARAQRAATAPPLLVLLDAPAPGTTLEEANPLADFVTDVARILDLDTEQVDVTAGPEVVIGELARQLGFGRTDGVAGELRRQWTAFRHHRSLLHRYVPSGTYEGETLLVTCTANQDELRRWEPWLGPTQVLLVPGDHYDVVRRSAARRIRASIDEAIRARGCHADPTR